MGIGMTILERTALCSLYIPQSFVSEMWPGEADTHGFAYIQRKVCMCVHIRTRVHTHISRGTRMKNTISKLCNHVIGNSKNK